ncbi:MAG: hypothetical protein V1734_00450 [Nanoarchaeota archaeon]
MALVIICSVFSIYLINPVSAEDTSENLGCCEMTTGGESCRYTNVDSCNSEGYKVAPYQRCEESTFCKVGCCISPDGSCSKQVSKGTCENAGDGYMWDADATCASEQCNKGCCVLGGAECKFTTEKRCSGITGSFEGLEIDFRNAVATEKECTDVCKAQDDGCCLKATGDCKRTTRGLCGLDDGTGSAGFYKDIFCSNENLRCDPKCMPHARKGCVEGLEDVYWFDSCGNREEVVTETIGYSDNPEKNGNCDYARGTLCSSKIDDTHPTAYCKSVNCKAADVSDYPQINYDGVARYNGESWCVYDSKPGPASDTVGSRHWRHICINGEEIVEPCKDYREEMCAQMDVKNIPPEGSQYREAGCIANKAKTCSLDCNTLKEAESDAEKEAAYRADKKCCQSISRSCTWQATDEDKHEGMCMPIVPMGLSFWGDEEGNVDDEAREICNSWNTEVETVWSENAFKWCPENCNGRGSAGERRWDATGRGEVYTIEALQTNNVLCNSAGDCGAKYNYLGKFNNEGYYRAWDKDAPFTTEQVGSFGSDDLPVENDMSTNNLPETMTWSYLFSNVGKGIYGGEKDFADIAVPGTSGSVGMYAFEEGINYAGYAAAWTFTSLFLAVYLSFAITVASTLTAGVGGITAFFTLGLAGIAEGIAVPAVTAAGIASPTGLGAAGTMALPAVTLPATTTGSMAQAAVASSVVPAIGWAIAAVLLAITIILLAIIYSAGEETRMVTTTCEPWIAPTGGDDCAKCDIDPLHPCSDYRCRSLGQNCEFISENEGRTEMGTCYDEDPNDISRPKIKAWAEDNHPLGLWVRQTGIRTDVSNEYTIEALPADAAIQAGYKIKKASGDGKLPTFSTLEFGIKTYDNEGELRGAQCKYTTEYKPGLTFATMSNWFPNSYYSKEHNMTIYGLTSNKIYEYYIICRGPNGYPKEDEVTPPYKISFETGDGVDLEAPAIVDSLSTPPNNGYAKAGDNVVALFYIDEVSPFRCKMSKQDVDYLLMDTNVSCAARSAESLFAGYGICAANLTLEQGANTFYIRCKDQPISGNDPNIMDESYVYTVTQSKPLNINNILPPAGTITYLRNVTMQVATEKGVSNGKAICSYDGRSTAILLPLTDTFFKTNENYHEQLFSGLPRGFYNFRIDCYDEAGNEASAITNFSVEADMAYPNVIAMYKDAAGLHITLDEQASCEYSNSRFTYGSGTTASTESASATFPATMTKYYIICKDKSSNTMPEIIIKTEF